MIYLCAVLLDDGRNQESVNAALDEVAQGHLAGLDHSFGGYLDAQAAEGLMRLGRWSEAEATLARHMAYRHTAGQDAAGTRAAPAMLAGGRWDGEKGDQRSSPDAIRRPTDGFHQTFLDTAVRPTSTRARELGRHRRGGRAVGRTRPRSAALWSARDAMLCVAAAVEQSLDAVASGQPVQPI